MCVLACACMRTVRVRVCAQTQLPYTILSSQALLAANQSLVIAKQNGAQLNPTKASPRNVQHAATGYDSDSDSSLGAAPRTPTFNEADSPPIPLTPTTPRAPTTPLTPPWDTPLSPPRLPLSHKDTANAEAVEKMLVATEKGEDTGILATALRRLSQAGVHTKQASPPTVRPGASLSPQLAGFSRKFSSHSNQSPGWRAAPPRPNSHNRNMSIISNVSTSSSSSSSSTSSDISSIAAPSPPRPLWTG
jgi:hypothetical protein